VRLSSICYWIQALGFRFPEITSLSTQFHSAAPFCGIDPALGRRVDSRDQQLPLQNLEITSPRKDFNLRFSQTVKNALVDKNWQRIKKGVTQEFHCPR
jgi:hypothetical protein